MKNNPKGEVTPLLSIKSTPTKTSLWTTKTKFDSLEAAEEKINSVFTNNVAQAKDKKKHPTISQNLQVLEVEILEKEKSKKNEEKNFNNSAAKLLLLYAVAFVDDKVESMIKKNELPEEFKKAHPHDKVYFYIKDLLNALQISKKMPELTESELEVFDKLGSIIAYSIRKGNEETFANIEAKQKINIAEYVKNFSLEEFVKSIKENKNDAVLNIILQIDPKQFGRNYLETGLTRINM